MQEKADESTQDKAIPPKELDNAASMGAEADQAGDTDTSSAMVRNLSEI